MAKRDKKKKSAVQSLTFRSEDTLGTKTKRFYKVEDSIGRKLTSAETSRLRKANYNPYMNNVSVKKGENGKLIFNVTVKKKKKTNHPSASSRAAHRGR